MNNGRLVHQASWAQINQPALLCTREYRFDSFFAEQAAEIILRYRPYLIPHQHTGRFFRIVYPEYHIGNILFAGNKRIGVFHIDPILPQSAQHLYQAARLVRPKCFPINWDLYFSFKNNLIAYRGINPRFLIDWCNNLF